MKIFCCFTPAHEILYKDYFLPTLPETFSVVASQLEISGSGDFLSPEFLRCICQKIELVLQSIRENSGEVIVWSDIDIQFFGLDPNALVGQLGDHDIVFQREGEGQKVSDVNTGFFACRCNERMYAFFELVRDGLQKNPSTNEQHIINDLLRSRSTQISWGYLPMSYYARTHGWPPPRDLVLYHANATAGSGGVQRKIQQFQELAFLRKYPFPALIYTTLKYAPKRIARLFSRS